MLERVHQVTYIMLVTKDICKKVYEYIKPWDKNL